MYYINILEKYIDSKKMKKLDLRIKFPKRQFKRKNEIDFLIVLELYSKSESKKVIFHGKIYPFETQICTRLFAAGLVQLSRLVFIFFKFFSLLFVMFFFVY